MKLYEVIKLTKSQYAVVLQSDRTKIQYRSSSRLFCREWVETNEGIV